MNKSIDFYFGSIVSHLLGGKRDNQFSIFDPEDQFNINSEDDPGIAQSLNSAFLMALSRGLHPKSESAEKYLTRMRESSQWGEVADFYLNGIDLMYEEINERYKRDKEFADRLKTLFHWLCKDTDRVRDEETRERVWSLFFPEGKGILAEREKMIKELRAKRTVSVREKNKRAITDPVRQILFTSNVLLTVPPASAQIKDMTLSDSLKKKLSEIIKEEQIYWYDHPIQVGVNEENNEFLYGLKGLEQAYLYELEQEKLLENEGLKCLLSVSVTHEGLHDIARLYLEEVLRGSDCLNNIDVFVLTERDTQEIVEKIISPAARRYLDNSASAIHEIFGVDGEYGRHYSFLKAVSALWNVIVDNDIMGTFKIDLDQVFPQKKLKEETGYSAFEHFKTGLWGASGVDSKGKPVELGMIAGALVNNRDIAKGLFTPDVVFPRWKLAPDEYIFFSCLPQALSTEAEMMTRYGRGKIDGRNRCIERIHVTGGTNGILIDSLRRHRPFTPSFIGRAEDQAYILSCLLNKGDRLAYLHKDGLFMRHDKESFAREAIESARVGKLIGDYIRILYFSSYARLLSEDISKLKNYLDPFTGCFISKIPVTVVYLRFALKAVSLFSEEDHNEGIEFIKTGSRRIGEAFKLTSVNNNVLKEQYEKERLGWNLYYDTLSAVEYGIAEGDEFALELKGKAEGIFNRCLIKG
jgi:hypothetical protein